MSVDLDPILSLGPEAALEALKEASRRLLLPVDVDRRLRDAIEVSNEPEEVLRAVLTKWFEHPRAEPPPGIPIR